MLGVLTEGTRSLKDESGSEKFLKLCGKLDDLKIKNITKIPLKREYQLLFELANKALLLRTDKCIVVTGTDLFLYESSGQVQECKPSCRYHRTYA